ncbi:MarR family transcriptional regulator [uncultured Gemmiger sp.]|uniref:MarR family winged helix-turn-helix transcriptional regulator n=1 Tax=uncultured Gemmiger sp. TaxID=1623490 RepID=UPI0025E82B17|nr:MarR family transcriptional regulator [uncultured Gemmiger sp.]
MLDRAFYNVYTKFKLHFYQKVFSRFENREATLTTVEAFCMEGIMALKHPTIAQFAQVMHISTPNASYKINSLIQKGYVEKERSETDRREYHLRPTKKYMDYYSISYAYLQTVVDRVKARFPAEDVARLDQMLTVIGNELMPEITIPEEKG